MRPSEQAMFRTVAMSGSTVRCPQCGGKYYARAMRGPICAACQVKAVMAAERAAQELATPQEPR